MTLLSQTAEHALRAVLFLARQPRPSPVAASAVAEALGAPPNYMAKTLNLLAKRGIVRGTRGPGGGFRLVASPDALTVADLVDAVDETPETPGMCLLGGAPCDPALPCQAHTAWTAVQERARAPLHATHIQDLLAGDLAGGPDTEPLDGAESGARSRRTRR